VIPSHLSPRRLAIFSNQLDATQGAGTEPGSLVSQLDRQQIVYFSGSHSFLRGGGRRFCDSTCSGKRVKNSQIVSSPCTCLYWAAPTVCGCVKLSASPSVSRSVSQSVSGSVGPSVSGFARWPGLIIGLRGRGAEGPKLLLFRLLSQHKNTEKTILAFSFMRKEIARNPVLKWFSGGPGWKYYDIYINISANSFCSFYFSISAEILLNASPR